MSYTLFTGLILSQQHYSTESPQMKFTHNEFAHIERTISKFDTIARTLLASDSTVVADVRALAYIVAELRTTAGLMADQDRSTQQAGLGRVFSLFANMPE
jgi:hypothetical protein